ncbi:hypothetical protein OROGR_004552 [Orobanche gracilis]
MAAATFSSLILLLQLLSLTTTFLFLKTSGALVDNVCSQTRDPSLCSISLRSYPRSQTANLSDLAQMTINAAQDKAIDAKMKIHDYMLEATDSKLRGLYSECEDFYLDALDVFRAAPGELKGHQYGALHQLGMRVRGWVDGCEAAFDNNSPFKNENQVVGVLADAITVIAKNL